MSNTDSSGSPNFKKYGVPFYAVAWIPDKAVQFIYKSQEQQPEPDQTQSNDDFTSCGNYVVLAGGGGEGRSGIPNAVVVARFDPSSNFLTDDPVNLNYAVLYVNLILCVTCALQAAFHLSSLI